MKHVRVSTKKQLNTVGLDISDGSLELAYITRDEKSNLSFQSLTRIELYDNVIVHGLIKKPKDLSRSIKDLYTQAQLNPSEYSVITALPDAQVVIKTIPVSHHKTPSLEYLDLLAQSAVKHLNLNIRQPIIKWIYYPETNHSGRVQLFITERKYVAQWKRFFKTHSISLRTVEMESLALARALLPNVSKNQNPALLDFGHRSTNLSILDHSGLLYSHALEIGGMDITIMLARQLHISDVEAHDIKESTGLKKRVKNDVSNLITGKLTQILRGLSLSDIVQEFQVTSIVISGGGANMPGIVEFLKKTLTKPVHEGNIALRNSNRNIKIINPKITLGEQRLFAGSIGLAMRGSEMEHRPRELNFLS